MISNLFDAHSNSGVDGEKAFDQLLHLIADEARRGVFCCQNLAVEHHCVVVLEGQIATNHCKQDDSTAPEVALVRHIALPSDHLWWCVTRGPARGLQPLVVRKHVAEPEVNDFDAAMLIQQKILGLQIPVDDLHAVNLLDPSHDLVKEAASFRLRDTASADDVVKQLTTARILHDEKQLPRSFDDLIQLHHVRVPDELQDLDLTGNTLDIGHVHNLLLLQHLDRYSLACQDMPSKLHLAKGTFSNGLAKDIVPKVLAGPLRTSALLRLNLRLGLWLPSLDLNRCRESLGRVSRMGRVAMRLAIGRLLNLLMRR